MARFYIGQPVVCVDGRIKPSVARKYPQVTNWPVEGTVYVIRANMPIMTQVARNRWTPLTFVLVQGITNPIITYGNGTTVAEAGFHEDRFEPATNIGDLEAVRDVVGTFHGRVDHIDEPGIEWPEIITEPRKKETVE